MSMALVEAHRLAGGPGYDVGAGAAMLVVSVDTIGRASSGDACLEAVTAAAARRAK